MDPAAILTAIAQDDLATLQFFVSRGLSVDFMFPPLARPWPPMLHDSPPLISVAAFHDAEACVRYLFANRADLTAVDQKRVFLAFIGRSPISRPPAVPSRLSSFSMRTGSTFQRKTRLRFLFGPFLPRPLCR
jgi:hypothetical protein